MNNASLCITSVALLAFWLRLDIGREKIWGLVIWLESNAAVPRALVLVLPKPEWGCSCMKIGSRGTLSLVLGLNFMNSCLCLQKVFHGWSLFRHPMRCCSIDDCSCIRWDAFYHFNIVNKMLNVSDSLEFLTWSPLISSASCLTTDTITLGKSSTSLVVSIPAILNGVYESAVWFLIPAVGATSNSPSLNWFSQAPICRCSPWDWGSTSLYGGLYEWWLSRHLNMGVITEQPMLHANTLYLLNDGLSVQQFPRRTCRGIVFRPIWLFLV